ncbi:MAG: amidohydrolase family protein [Chloroflexi bacterium]|nr:amidohydrolase family protein [Chloroflexota bacterium]MDA1172982.1 amidohydrolase family protein [Chloroflexota bacterium]
MAIIDADAHVVENEYTWDFMPEEDQPHRPAILVPKPGHKTRAGEYWFIDGRVFAKDVNVGLDTDLETREASDVKKRLAHMDELGVTTHVLYPTVFLRPLAYHQEVEVALARGYNRWVGNIHAQSEGRLRWTVIVPTSRMDIAIEELNYGKEHGACGVFMRGIEGDHRLSDPYLYPLWEEAQRLDLPICIHAATGKFEFFDYFSRDAGFSTFKLPAVGAFHDIIMKDMHKKFPDLRWGFVEISASWLPYAMNDLSVRYTRQGIPWAGRELLQERNIFVAVQTTDDIDYIVETAGEDNLMIGTDYGHNDTSTELRALTNLRDNGGLSPALVEKILDANPRRLYAL